MGAYKQFNSQDIIVSPLEVNKSFTFRGNELTGSDVGIDRYLGESGEYPQNSTLTGQIPGRELYAVLVYNSIKQLYYSNYISGSNGFIGEAAVSSTILGANREGDTPTGLAESTNYYNYLSTTLWPNRHLPIISNNSSAEDISRAIQILQSRSTYSENINDGTETALGFYGVSSYAGVISIPSKLFGDYIQPNSFYMEGPSGSIKDDGEGRLLWKHNNSSIVDYEYMNGNIIYEHGIITTFDSETSISSSIRTDSIEVFITSSNVTMSFSSSYNIFETQYKTTIQKGEFNYSLNPSSISGSEIPKTFSGSDLSYNNTSSYGKPYDFVTSSYFNPYITTIGLYNNDFELLAIGKLAKPTQPSTSTDTTFLINIDR